MIASSSGQGLGFVGLSSKEYYYFPTQVKFGQAQYVTGVATQGRYGGSEYVTSYHVMYLDPHSPEQWLHIKVWPVVLARPRPGIVIK